MAREVNEQEFRLIDRVSSGLQTIAGGIGRLRTGLTELNQGAELAAKGIDLVRSAAESIGGAVQGVADYQTAMARVNQITQATAEEQKALAAAVQSAQVELGVSADVSANALLKLARDGASATEAVNALGGVLAYAKANAQDAGAATEQLGGILDSFGARPAIIGKLADALTATAVASGTTSEALAKGLQGIGLAADEAGLSVNQTVALLGQLATRNIEGTNATKQLVTILGQFRDPASAAGKALTDLGLSGQSFTEILGKLSTDSTAATAVLNTLGNKPRAALQALLADGGGALKELNQIIGQSEGSAKKAADALKGTFNDSLQRASAAVEQLKIAAAGPVLTPLADGLTALAERLTVVAQSPELANLAKQFAEFATKSTEQLINFIATIDFAEATQKIADFVSSAADNLETLAKVASTTASAIGTVYDVIKGGSAVVVESFAGVANDLAEVATAVGIPAENLARAFDDMAKGANVLSNEALASLQKRFGLTEEQALRTAAALGKTAQAARITTAEMQALAIAALPEPLRIVAQAALDARAGLASAGEAAAAAGAQINRIPPAPVLVATGEQAQQTAVSIASLEAELAKLNEQLQKAPVGSPQFTQLQQQISDLQERIKTLKGGTDNAGTSVQNFGNSAGNATGQVQRLGDETEGAAKKIENFGSNAAAAALDLGDMSSAFFEQTTQAANAQASLGDYLDVLNRGTAIYEDQALQFKRRLEISQQIIRANDEEAQAIDRLTKAYPALSRGALRELYEAEKKVADIRQKKNEVTAQGLNLEQAAARAASGTAGALGFGAGQNQGPQANQGTGAAGGGGSVKGGAIVINMYGTEVTPEQVARALERAQRLGR